MSILYVVRKGSNPKNRNLEVYQGRFKQTIHLSKTTMAKDISDACSATASDVEGVIASLAQVMMRQMEQGYIVRLGEFGSFKLSISSELASDKDSFTKSMIRGLRVVFTPGAQLRTALDGATFQAAM